MGQHKVTDAFLDFIDAHRTYDSLPPEVVTQTKTMLFDAIGNTVGGIASDKGQIGIQMARKLGGMPEATVYGTDQKVSAAAAAFANGELQNGLDYDPVPHVPPVVIPAVLAVAEAQHATGKELITATAVGSEIASRLSSVLMRAMRPETNRGGMGQRGPGGGMAQGMRPGGGMGPGGMGQGMRPGGGMGPGGMGQGMRPGGGMGPGGMGQGMRPGSGMGPGGMGQGMRPGSGMGPGGMGQGMRPGNGMGPGGMGQGMRPGNGMGAGGMGQGMRTAYGADEGMRPVNGMGQRGPGMGPGGGGMGQGMRPGGGMGPGGGQGQGRQRPDPASQIYGNSNEHIIGAAVACGMLLGLDREKMAQCIGISAALCSLPIARDWGTAKPKSMIKYFPASWLAHTAVCSAQLAESGYTANPWTLDSDYGFPAIYCRIPGVWNPDKVIDGLGETWQWLRIGVKPYPCCRYLHSNLDNLYALLNEYHFKPEEIDEIRCYSAKFMDIEGQMNVQTQVDAQFSTPYTIALAVFGYEPGPAWQSKEALTDPTIKAFMPKVKMYTSEDHYTYRQQDTKSWYAKMEIDVKGQTYTSETMYSKGTNKDGYRIEQSELEQRFFNNSKIVLSSEKIGNAIKILKELEVHDNLEALFRSVRPS